MTSNDLISKDKAKMSLISDSRTERMICSDMRAVFQVLDDVPVEKDVRDEPIMVDYIGEDWRAYTTAECPMCGQQFDVDSAGYRGRYCYSCGQALRWGDI